MTTLASEFTNISKIFHEKFQIFVPIYLQKHFTKVVIKRQIVLLRNVKVLRTWSYHSTGLTAVEVKTTRDDQVINGAGCGRGDGFNKFNKADICLQTLYRTTRRTEMYLAHVHNR